VFAAKVFAAGDHATALIVKLPVPNAVVLGTAPVTGAVTIIATLSVGIEAVAGNVYDIVTVLPVLLDITAGLPFAINRHLYLHKPRRKG